MTEQVASDSPVFSIARWMSHWPPLFAAMAAPYFLFQPLPASLVSAATGIVYVFWSVGTAEVYKLWSIIRKAPRERNEQRVPWRVKLLVFGFQGCVPIMAEGVMIALFIGWLTWAYDVESRTNFGTMHWHKQAVLASVLAALILGPALFLRFAPAFARKDGGPASQLLKGIREQGLGHFHQLWLPLIILCLATACLLLIVVFAVFLNLEMTRNIGGVVPIWDLSIALPYLPAALFAAAVMLSASKLCPDNKEGDIGALARAYIEGDAAAPALDSRAKSVLGLTVAGGWAATLFVLLYPIHLGMVAEHSSLVGVSPLTETAVAVEAWVPAQREAGRSTAEIAAELNRIGSWTPDAPDAGLATLVEDPGQVFADTCSVRVAAGVTDPSSHDAFGWLPAEQAASDLKYCIAVSCASPVAWDAAPALLLYSSHDSQAAHWTESWFIDFFADGAAAAPGGYCTADGRLADGFQG